MNFEFEDIKHLFVINARDNEWNEILINNFKGGVKALNKFKLWEWIRTLQPVHGFCFSDDENVIKISEETYSDGHTGASFGCMMRELQRVSCILISKTTNDMEICPICLNEDSDKKVVLECGHQFHYSCISYVNDFCPMCRAQTVPDYLNGV